VIQFEEIDETGMWVPPDTHLNSQQWKPVTPFFLPTSVLSSRPSSTTPDVSHSQHPIDQEIDTTFEIDMIKQILIKIQELQRLSLTMEAQQPPPPTPNNATVTFLPVFTVLVDEIKHIRNFEDIKLKSYKDITENVTLNFVV
jgi:hypothetical protein